MKKIIFSLLVFALALSACGASKSDTTSSTAGDPNARSLPPISQLIIGTFKLEGTKQAVSKEQATQLLPLWEVYGSLMQSETSAQAEIDGLIQQIQDTMTKEQLQAIQAMTLTQRDLFALMQEKGIEMAGPGGQNLSAEQIATVQALRSSGSGGQGQEFRGGQGMPMPPDGATPGSGPGGSVRISGTQATGGQLPGRVMDRVPSGLLDSLVGLLKKKASP
jgi:flagellar hook-associated protein FlgK